MMENFWFKSPHYATSTLTLTSLTTSVTQVASELEKNGWEMMKTDPQITPIVAFELMCSALGAVKNPGLVRIAHKDRSKILVNVMYIY